MTGPRPETHRSLWRCPQCGQTFTSRNLPHSCQVIGLDELFAGAPAVLRDTFERLVAAAGESGEVTVNVTKSRATLQARMRFAGIERPRKAHLVAHLVLTRPLESERFTRVEPLAPYYHVHWLRLREPADVDAELTAWLAEAYQIGLQRHVTDPDWPRVAVGVRVAPRRDERR
jgi:endogenous inhibitor of DNA gyrase (YacG/DUF329 family)